MPKKRNFDPHAAKALNKKIWYLRDQQVVAMTGQENQPAEAHEATISQKDRQPQKVKPLRTEKRKNYPDRINHSKATDLVTISPKAILGIAHHPAIKNHRAGQNHTLAAQQVVMTDLKVISGTVHHPAIKKAFRHAASLTRAGQQVAIATTGQKGASAQAHLPVVKENHILVAHHLVTEKKDQKETLVPAHLPVAKENPTLAVHQPVKVKKDQKETLAAAVPAKRNHIHPHVRVPQIPILAINLKEVLAQSQKEQRIKNLAIGPKVDLKNAKAVSQKISQLTMPINHNVSQLTIR